MFRKIFRIFVVIAILVCLTQTTGIAQVTLLVPSKPDLPASVFKAGKTGEVDVLVARMLPYEYKCLSMDMPQLFAVLRYDEQSVVKNGHLVPARRDLLVDMEEIRYLGQKAWGANVELALPGLYHFIMETKPWWNEDNDVFMQQEVKVLVPVGLQEQGWWEQDGLRFEILPMTRPFGLSAPAFFEAKALWEGKALANIKVSMQRINSNGQKTPTFWHRSLEARSAEDGSFAFILPSAGWWCCKAETEGSPLKGSDGQPKKLLVGTLFWLYVDNASSVKR